MAVSVGQLVAKIHSGGQFKFHGYYINVFLRNVTNEILQYLI